MHAGFPCFTKDIQRVIDLGLDHRIAASNLVDGVGGPVLAGGMALLLKLGFGYVMRDCLLDQQQAARAMAFFDENFVIRDPNAPGGQRYYQGKFLLRTRKPGDNMNVWLRFCPRPDELFVDTGFGPTIDSLKVVQADVVDEAHADSLEADPQNVDLVIRFKDIDSILGLVGAEDVDIVDLLLQNVVQLSGNVGHLFKLGAIATNIEIELGLVQAA